MQLTFIFSLASLAVAQYAQISSNGLVPLKYADCYVRRANSLFVTPLEKLRDLTYGGFLFKGGAITTIQCGVSKNGNYHLRTNLNIAVPKSGASTLVTLTRPSDKNDISVRITTQKY